MPPHKGKFVAYYRVSTQKQGNSGLGLEAQQKIVADHLDGGEWELIEEVTEVESGKRSDRHRPELARALKICNTEGATLVIAKLDRLTRNMPFLTRLLESKTDFIACDIPDMGNPTQNRFLLQLLGNVAEYEGALISERTRAGLAAAKQRGAKLGTPDPEAGAMLAGEFVAKRADDFAREVGPVIDELKLYGCSTLQKIALGLEARGVRTARGRTKWSASAVRNLIHRYTNLSP